MDVYPKQILPNEILVMNTNLPINFIERVATIDEVLSDEFVTIESNYESQKIANQKLQKWCKHSAGGDWQQFNKRLMRDGYEVDFILGRFAGARFLSHHSKPLWFYDSEWVLDCLTSHDDIKNEVEVTENFPFIDLYLNLISASTCKLKQLIVDGSDLSFSKKAINDLMLDLLSRVSELCEDAIYGEFKKFKISIQSLDVFVGDIESQNQIYLKFLFYMRNQGFKTLFNEKPVLLRLISVVTRQWIEAQQELMCRFSEDKCAIAKIIGENKDDLIVCDIKTGLSDLHNSGKSVSILDFGGNRKIVYKPKNLKIDEFWKELIDRLNLDSPDILLRAPSVINKGQYGWVEHIEFIECCDSTQVSNFYKKLGALLAIFHILAASDMHFENIIASGENPVAIDLEMLFQVSFLDSENTAISKSAVQLAATKAVDSVLSVGLLPNFIKSTGGKIYSSGGASNSARTIRKKNWKFTNTDQMNFEYISLDFPGHSNLPIKNSSIDLFATNIEGFILGFREYSQYLISIRDVFGLDWVIRNTSDLYSRKVIRPTNFYGGLISRLSNHASMTNGVDWSCDLDFMSRFFNWDLPVDPMWPILKGERLALAGLNIPIFLFSINGDNLTDGFSDICEIQCKSGVERVVERFLAYDELEIDWQCDVIKSSAISSSVYQSLIPLSPVLVEKSNSLVIQEFFLGEAKVIGEALLASAVCTDNSIAWIGMDWLGGSNHSQLSPLGFDLYNGNSGIALFLAALSKETGDLRFQNAAINAFSELRKNINGSASQIYARRIGLGGGVGLGSLVYSLATTSELIESDVLIRDSERCAELMTSELIKSDQNLDVLSGAAGAILGLLKLYKVSGSDIALSKAIECAEHLLSLPVYENGPSASWLTAGVGHMPLTGMSHGASGFAYALIYLSKVSGQDKFAKFGIKCLNYEDSQFNKIFCNWPDYREGVPPSDKYKVCQWCNGAVGIGLSRLAISKFKIANETNLQADIIRALEALNRYGQKNLDTLCCGELGEIEFLLEKNKGNEGNSDLIKSKVLNIIERAHGSGGYQFGGGPSAFHLSLFRGVSGVGYTLLRMVNNKLPNLLILE